MLVAVEDDEVEVLDLLGEQLARREGDERELVDRRAVLLLRRAQNREVHEIDGGVRLQQVAPHALAGVRLAGDQQHAQVLAHALGRHHHAVVGGGELARRRLQLDLDDVLAGVRERHLDRHGAADLGGARLVGAAFAADLEGDPVAGAALAAGLDHARLDVARRADDAVARRLQHLDAAVELVGLAGQQRVHGSVEAQRLRRLGHVVHLAVGDHDDAGQPVGRRVGERAVEVGEQVGAGRRLAGGLRGGDPAHLQIGEGGELRLQLAPDGRRLLGPAGDRSGSCSRRRRRWRCWRGSRAPPAAASDWRAPAAAPPATGRAAARRGCGGRAAAPPARPPAPRPPRTRAPAPSARNRSTSCSLYYLFPLSPLAGRGSG